MVPECNKCLVDFDLDQHRPKVLPCGDTICQECVKNLGVGGTCPTCKMDLDVGSDKYPDNNLVIRHIEKEGSKETRLQQLQRGVATGRKLVQQLRQLVPVAVEALNQQLDSSAAHLRQLEEALEREAAEADDDVGTKPDWPVAPLKLVGQLEESLDLLTNAECSVVVEREAGTFRAAVQPGQFGNLLLLQLQAAGPFQKVDNVAVSAAPAGHVGPPIISTLSIKEKDLDEKGDLKVKDILRDVDRWKNIRSLKNLGGGGSVRLLRVVAPHLEELTIAGVAGLDVMMEVEKMSSLKRLDMKCVRNLEFYPNLPLELEELVIDTPSEEHLCSVQRMPRLRSLLVWDYVGPAVSFPPARHGGLLWLGVAFNVEEKTSMISLIRANSCTLQELQIHVYNPVNKLVEYYYPELGQDLAASNLQVLRRLVLERALPIPCENVDACFLQRRTIKCFLPPSVDICCSGCQRSNF